MSNLNTMTRSEFLKLSSDDIKGIVNQLGVPKTGVFIPDGTRRSAMVFLGLNPKQNDFEERYIEIEGKQFLKNVKMMFDFGLHTLFIPSLKHENYNRDKRTINAIIFKAMKSMLIGEDWIQFYKDYNVKVKVYGDLDFVKKKGYPEILDWAKEIEEMTRNYTKHRIFHGIACSNIYEHRRLMDLAVDFYTTNNRKPTDDEKIQLYYRENVEEVDFLIRATAIRDSDLQPPIISGRKTQMYFLVAPDHISFSEKIFKEILYDLIFSRSPKFGIKEYNENDYDTINLEYMKKYYLKNKSKVLGLGEKIGSFWVPYVNIMMPKKDNLKK